MVCGAVGAKGKYSGKYKCSLSIHLALASCEEQGPPIARPHFWRKTQLENTKASLQNTSK